MNLQNLQWAAIRTVVNTSLSIKSSSWFSPNTQPNLVKTYNDRHDLYPARIFLPADHAGEKLPLVICVHGGGFIVNNPSGDDPLARHLADNAKCIVVSIDYRKSPQNKFPRAHEDVLEQALAVIADTELPIDRNKVALCGSSAGGNLVFGAVQNPRLRSKICGIVGIYPLVDFIPSREEKMASRPDPSIKDFMGQDGENYSNVGKLYLDENNMPDFKDVRVSPTHFKSREDLPADVLLTGCEHDMLCREAEDMAEKLAGKNPKVEDASGWRAGSVQWYKAMGQTHAFEAFALKDAEKEKVRVQRTDEMRNVISKWLQELFSKGGR